MGWWSWFGGGWVVVVVGGGGGGGGGGVGGVHRCHMYSGAGCMDVWVRNMVTEDNTYSWTLNGSPRNPNCEDGDGYTCVTICLQLEADPADMFYTCHFLPITCCTQLSVRGLE